MMTVDDALKISDVSCAIGSYPNVLASEVCRLRDEVNGLTGSLDRAEKALKEAQEQEPVAFWWIGPDGKDNGGPYRGKPSDAAIDNALNMGCEPVLLYARPVPANLVESHHIARASNSIEFEGIRTAPAEDDMAEIHQLAYELGGTDSGEYILDGEQLDQVILKAASLYYKPAVAVPAAPSVPEEWRWVMAKLISIVEASTKFHGCDDVTKQARALLRSAPQPTNGDAK